MVAWPAFFSTSTQRSFRRSKDLDVIRRVGELDPIRAALSVTELGLVGVARVSRRVSAECPGCEFCDGERRGVVEGDAIVRDRADPLS